MIKGIDHVTINVIDLQKSFAFYEEFLGFKKLPDIDMGDHRLYYYAISSGTRLELIEYDEKTEIIQSQPDSRGLYRHIALVAENIDEMFSRCQEMNIPVRLLPQYNEKLGAKIMLLEDPNGVEIELVEK